MEPASAPWRILEPPPDPDVAPESAPPGGAGTGRPAVPWMAVAAGVGALILAVAAFLLASQPAPVIDVTGVDTETRAPGSAGPGTTEGVVVDVSGAVVRPGLYTLPAGARVADAIEAAGGFGPRVDAAGAEQALNLAETITDGSKIRVPSRDDAAATGVAGGGAGGSGGTAGGLVNVNTASASELDGLPGVGPATAAKIIAAREEQPFASVEDLKARKVVGAATFDKLRDLVTIGP